MPERSGLTRRHCLSIRARPRGRQLRGLAVPPGNAGTVSKGQQRSGRPCYGGWGDAFAAGAVKFDEANLGQPILVEGVTVAAAHPGQSICGPSQAKRVLKGTDGLTRQLCQSMQGRTNSGAVQQGTSVTNCSHVGNARVYTVDGLWHGCCSWQCAPPMNRSSPLQQLQIVAPRFAFQLCCRCCGAAYSAVACLYAPVQALLLPIAPPPAQAGCLCRAPFHMRSHLLTSLLAAGCLDIARCLCPAGALVHCKPANPGGSVAAVEEPTPLGLPA